MTYFRTNTVILANKHYNNNNNNNINNTYKNNFIHRFKKIDYLQIQEYEY